jgi:hypothetical protein
LETIVGRIDREVEAAALGLSPWKAGLVRQNPQHGLAEQAVARIVGRGQRLGHSMLYRGSQENS